MLRMVKTMARFIFKMQNVLTVKEKLESQAKTAYGLAAAKLHLEEERLAVIIGRIVEREEWLAEELSTSLKVVKVRELQDGIDVLKFKKTEQEFVVEAAKEELEKAQEALNLAMQERKIYEKLKENAFDEFKKELVAEEQKEVDELVSFRFGNGGI